MPNKYSQDPQDEIDLHQMTRKEAREAILEFLDISKNQGKKIVRIITGKGLHSSSGPVLGDFARALLDEYEYDYRDAKINQGAHGAIDVKL
ncbi:MAG: hypothetical protein CO042_02070 [Parcubacteria group bacterium CG_4_9_14_0_2_um_filter_41_8]|nr:MAG: hypothetical protein AUJ34_01375 [Parcubacteria group bacterium CG1_02_41_12]PIP67407.1 MAG: hypothetical protein COW93_00265 [Parcubacteria group bacterium CG22_combo_CG10-13_8_21_14_all_41_9]PIQ78335.1 MAG: hypothetical protein COV79_05365 [Parcubacteria group bacterium CG11_big_fil_rev_8_21_14_0_20_41_14]PIR57437.1 MAG: hypothetical protein COU72_00925 [Parcubacteria group bacterium CG10_big_fil_rev_8_21_14_0_10_41_35]PJC40753.1 MAG: hypothetical protein CO042_02070 [Parcubacteria gr